MSIRLEIKQKLEDVNLLFKINDFLLEKSKSLDIEKTILEKLIEIFYLGNKEIVFEGGFDIYQFDKELEIESMEDLLEVLNDFIEVKDYTEETTEQGSGNEYLKIIFNSMVSRMKKRYNYFKNGN
jgi:hypothetical protein